MAMTFQVEVFWVVTQCSVVVGWTSETSVSYHKTKLHYTAAQPRRPRLEASEIYVCIYTSFRTERGYFIHMLGYLFRIENVTGLLVKLGHVIV